MDKLQAHEAAAQQLYQDLREGDGCLRVQYRFADIGGECVRSRRHGRTLCTQRTSRQLQMVAQRHVVKLDYAK
eukprot:3192570-Karenia_brevis.AAC.1